METLYAQITSSDRYQLAMEAAGIGIWDNDLLTDKISFLGNGHELFGFAKGETVSLEDLVHCIHPADRERTRMKVAESLDPLKRAVYENEYRVADRATGESVRWIRAKGRAYFTEVGTPYRFIGTVQDISNEVKQRERTQKLLTLVDNSIELMSILENNQKNSYLNKAGMEMLGFDTDQQVYETPISELHAPEDIAFVEANVLPSVLKTGRWSGVMNVRHLKTGEIFPVYNNTIRIHDQVTGEPIAVGAVMRDMRPEMAVQKALEESEKNFRTLVMQAPVGICIFKGVDLEIEMVNDSFEEISNKLRSEIIGRKVIDVFPEATKQGFDQMLKQVMVSGQPFSAREFKVDQERHGQTLTRYFDFTFHPLREYDGQVTRIMDVSIDVTDKVMARKRLQESEEELQKRVLERTAELEKKNRELEEFTYVSSHDLQEPLRKIKIFREMIKEHDYKNLSDFSKVRFDKVGETIDRMSQSLKDLLNFASLEKEEAAGDVDLNTIFETVYTDLELLIETKEAAIRKPELPIIKGIPHQLYQLFYNLLGNALKFSKKDIPPVIDITAGPLQTQDDIPSVLDITKKYCLISIKDNGIGFEQEKAEKIFGLFQRLHGKQEYSGTGIGLALCRKVAAQHKGHLWVNAEPGIGATFFVALPVD